MSIFQIIDRPNLKMRQDTHLIQGRKNSLNQRIRIQCMQIFPPPGHSHCNHSQSEWITCQSQGEGVTTCKDSSF